MSGKSRAFENSKAQKEFSTDPIERLEFYHKITPWVTLRKAVAKDREMIFGWRNIGELVALSRSGKSVTWEEHCKWFRSVLSRDDTLLFIVSLKGIPIGQVRFDREDDRRFEVSIYLLPQYTGKGLGVLALKTACRLAFRRVNVHEIRATIRADNALSISAFKKAGFSQSESFNADSDPEFRVLSIEREPKKV